MGQKRLRGVPVFYEQVKKNRGIRLTDKAYNAINDAARAEGISLSEFVEKWGRRLKPTTHS